MVLWFQLVGLLLDHGCRHGELTCGDGSIVFDSKCNAEGLVEQACGRLVGRALIANSRFIPLHGPLHQRV